MFIVWFPKCVYGFLCKKDVGGDVPKHFPYLFGRKLIIFKFYSLT